MTDPVSLQSTTPRLGLPLLHVGQAQKEVTVNEALLRADALLQPAVEGELAAPPPSAEDGQAWIVAAGAGGAWTGHDGSLAYRSAGTWLFTAPFDGLTVMDKTAGQAARFDGAWMRATTPAAPSGGDTVDAEARTAIAELVSILVASGVLAAG
ncbi:DUF2793 domain-containing protein [Paraurantiacibacter namhicola]|uniref:DUF2793 domain-containing protein n=1 Tax=Paraurantiacibacter namhicola TaxID=645517 RepID=A0A1C7D566_9SPHN|nr:DUF2793 domain-containing protein [Paraurantiacibacter namhicola]ANU06605.1 hypothetical protein A6F65_00278 [Paraurantiacibacter namhicola]